MLKPSRTSAHHCTPCLPCKNVVEKVRYSRTTPNSVGHGVERGRWGVGWGQGVERSRLGQGVGLGRWGQKAVGQDGLQVSERWKNNVGVSQPRVCSWRRIIMNTA